jgi:hypothetical protein
MELYELKKMHIVEWILQGIVDLIYMNSEEHIMEKKEQQKRKMFTECLVRHFAKKLIVSVFF